MKGLRLSVYRPADLGYGDLTNGGVSGKADTVTVVGRLEDGKVVPLPKECQVFSADEDAPAVILVESRIALSDPTPHLIPLDLAEGTPPDTVGPMAGGNYAGTSDGRWAALGKLYGHLRLDVVAIHDRVETYRDYLSLSR